MELASCHPSGAQNWEVATRFSENLQNPVMCHLGGLRKRRRRKNVRPVLIYINNINIYNII
jgi:hypothetical protein